MTPQDYRIARDAVEAQIRKARTLSQNAELARLTAAQKALTTAQMRAEADVSRDG